MGTGTLPRPCDIAHLATATSSRAPSLPTAAENHRASGILPTAPTLQPCTGRRPGLNPAAPRPRVPPTRVATPADNYFNGTTAAPGALALSNTPHRATRALGLDPPRHIDSSRERRPLPRSYTPRPSGPDHTTTVGLRCGKAGAGTPEPLFSARLGVPPHERWAFWSVPYHRGFSETSYPAPSPRREYRAETPSGGHSRAAHPRPVFKFVWSVCRLSFVFACPRAPPPDFHGSSETGDPDTSRRTHGDSTTFGQRNRGICLPSRG